MAKFQTDVTKNDWTPTLRLLRAKGEPINMRARLRVVAQQIVALAKVSMTDQRGFADDVPYRKLKIKYRYHGRKQVMASVRNVRRATRSFGFATIHENVTFRRGGQVKTGDTVEVTDRTKVTSSTKALIDLGDLRRSWGVLNLQQTFVDIGNRTSLEKLKAAYNDDRGHWWWGRTSSEKAVKAWLDDFDKGIFRSWAG